MLGVVFLLSAKGALFDFTFDLQHPQQDESSGPVSFYNKMAATQLWLSGGFAMSVI